MENAIYPCLWFDNNAQQAAQYYCSVFKNAQLLQETPVVTTFSINGLKFMALDGGAKYAVNPAVSYYVYCDGEAEIVQLFDALSFKGNVLMPLGKYDWSPKYAWVQDQFGVNWQLDMDAINSTQKIVPALLFANEKMGLVKNAVADYTTIFPNSKILLEAPYPPTASLPEGTLLFAQFKIQGFIFNAMSSTMSHNFDFSPGNSFVVECADQAAIDYYWEKLGKGGRYEQCGWLVDKYDVSWQIVPAILGQLMQDPEKSARVIAAFLKMQKFDIATLLEA